MSRHFKRSLPGLLAILFFIAMAGALLRAQSAGPEQPAKTAEQFDVPQGTPEETLEFLTELKEKRPNVQTREELLDHYRKVFATVASTTEKLLKQELTEETRVEVLSARLEALGLLTRLGDPQAGKALKQLAEQLKDHKNAELAAAAREQLLQASLMEAMEGTPQQAASLIKDLKSYVEAGPLDAAHLRTAMTVAQGLEQAGHYAAALEANEILKSSFLKSGDPQLMAAAEELSKSAQKRLGVVGKPLELAGTLLDGKPLDWSKYEGKVVLVDFWATWCGPCRAELPNVKENYEKYHDRGFEVLGISLDDDRKALEQFVKNEELPWENLFSDDPKQNQGLADRYGIQGIPALLLVGRDGKVITLKARGEDLGKQLEKLLGKAEKSSADKS